MIELASARRAWSVERLAGPLPGDQDAAAGVAEVFGLGGPCPCRRRASMASRAFFAAGRRRAASSRTAASTACAAAPATSRRRCSRCGSVGSSSSRQSGRRLGQVLGQVADAPAGLLGAGEDALGRRPAGPNRDHVRGAASQARRRPRPRSAAARRCRGRRTRARCRPRAAAEPRVDLTSSGVATTPGGRWRRRSPAARRGGWCRGSRRGRAGRGGVAVRPVPKYCTSQPTQRRRFWQNRSTSGGKCIASRAARR